MISIFRKNVLAAALLLTATIPAQAQINCGTELIGNGDSVLKLLEACGKPTIGDVNNVDYAEWIITSGRRNL